MGGGRLAQGQLLADDRAEGAASELGRHRHEGARPADHLGPGRGPGGADDHGPGIARQLGGRTPTPPLAPRCLTALRSV